MIRVRYANASLLVLLLFSALEASALPARFGLAPDNNQEMVIDVIASARSQLVINIYQFESLAIVEEIEAAIGRGVTTKILIDGEPVAGLTVTGKKIIGRLQVAMKKARNSGLNRSNRLFLMTETSETRPRRFVFNHAKYIIVDGLGVYMSSENFTAGGHPAAGTQGNRGWSTYVEDRSLADQLKLVFKEDSSIQHDDVLDITLEGPSRNRPTIVEEAGTPRTQFRFPIARGDVDRTELILSPNSQSGLIRFMSSARRNLEFEQMSLPTNWKENGVAYLNTLVRGLLDAARRGVRVRALLNDETSFGGAPSANGNLNTARFLNQQAICFGWSVEARIVDTRALQINYIHNKGLTADGERAMVSSINGTRNSVVNNRETAIWLESADAAAYYGNSFDFDWGLSPDTPGVRGRATRRTPGRNPLEEAACPENIDQVLAGAPILGYLGIRH